MSADISLSDSGCCSAHSHNVTHNLAAMFREAGVDWHDYYERDGNGGRCAWQLSLDAGGALANLICDPDRFRELNPSNGWGDYEGAIEFLAHLVRDCHKHPEAIVEVSL